MEIGPLMAQCGAAGSTPHWSDTKRLANVKITCAYEAQLNKSRVDSIVSPFSKSLSC
jgi:hypothetical protein